MNLLEQVCKELGVEIGEEWLGSDGRQYIIESEGVLELDVCENSVTGERWKLCSGATYQGVLTGKIKPKWKPKRTEKYYVPCINSIKASPYLYDSHVCGFDEDYDEIMFERGLVFRTKEEAQECAINMIELAKHGI